VRWRAIGGEQVVRETFENIDDVQQEDGWVVLFHGTEAILRLQEIHVQSMERLAPKIDGQFRGEYIKRTHYFRGAD